MSEDLPLLPVNFYSQDVIFANACNCPVTLPCVPFSIQKYVHLEQERHLAYKSLSKAVQKVFLVRHLGNVIDQHFTFDQLILVVIVEAVLL